MPNRRTIGEARWPAAGEFVALAKAWQSDAVTRLLGFVWAAYDLLRSEVLAQVNCAQADRDLERSVTQYLEPRIRKIMPGDLPFYVQHGPHEFETAKKPPAQPPVPDIAFVLWANERVMWPLEAKTLRTDQAVNAYVTEIRDNFLTCRYAPFSGEGGMLGYLVAGEPAEAFSNIGANVRCKLRTHPNFPDRDHRTSDHERTVPPGKSYPRAFRCHHMILRLAV
ncbi:MAG: hypothetical protein V2A79_05010 [Planctomycetota bacterium]